MRAAGRRRLRCRCCACEGGSRGRESHTAALSAAPRREDVWRPTTRRRLDCRRPRRIIDCRTASSFDVGEADGDGHCNRPPFNLPLPRRQQTGLRATALVDDDAQLMKNRFHLSRRNAVALSPVCRQQKITSPPSWGRLLAALPLPSEAVACGGEESVRRCWRPSASERICMHSVRTLLPTDACCHRQSQNARCQPRKRSGCPALERLRSDPMYGRASGRFGSADPQPRIN